MVYPIAYPPNATSFSNNGLGYLFEATSCIVTEEANGSFELELVYPVTGKRFNDLETRTIILAKPNPVDPPQAFRIYAYTKPMDGQVVFNAEHISYDLAGYPVKPFTATNCGDALTKLKQNTVVSLPFTFWTDKTTSGTLKVENPTSIRSVLGGTEGSILDTYKGEYKFNNFEVRLYNSRGQKRNVTIRYGKNLLDVKQQQSLANVYTDVMPYWAGDVDDVHTVVTLPEWTLSTGTDYDFRKVLVLDLSSEFQEKPFVVDLRAAANTWISQNDPGKPSETFDVSFTQLEQTEEYKNLALLERVELFDTVGIEYPDFGISTTAKVTKTVYDAMLGKYNSVTLGDIRSNMSDTVAGQQDAIDSTVESVKTEIQQATENATNWITNGRGYMVAVKNENGQWMEICSLDNPNITQAVQVWRWNNGGFGHSSHGYNGPYDVAITQDGKINADFITTGEMTANRIRGGILLLGGTNNGNGIINTKNSRGEDLCTIDSNGIDLYKGTITGTKLITTDPNNYYEEPTQIVINNSSIQFFEGMHTTDYVIDSYAGTIAPSPTWGCGAFYDGDGVVMYDEEGYFPSLELDARYLAVIIAGGSSLVRMNMDGVTFSKTVWFDSSLIGHSLSMNSGAFKDSLSVQGMPVTGDIIITSLGENEKKIVTTATSYGYSLTSPMKGDVGSGETDENGLCYVYLDDYANAAMNTSIEYYVFLQKEGPGDIWVKEKNEQYFIVEGTPNLKFSWELKGRQTGYESERLENMNALKMESEDLGNEIMSENLQYLASAMSDNDQDQLKEIINAISERGGT